MNNFYPHEYRLDRYFELEKGIETFYGLKKGQWYTIKEVAHHLGINKKERNHFFQCLRGWGFIYSNNRCTPLSEQCGIFRDVTTAEFITTIRGRSYVTFLGAIVIKSFYHGLGFSGEASRKLLYQPYHIQKTTEHLRKIRNKLGFL